MSKSKHSQNRSAETKVSIEAKKMMMQKKERETVRLEKEHHTMHDGTGEHEGDFILLD